MFCVRWLRVGLVVLGVVLLLSAVALLDSGDIPDGALAWVLLPLGGAALLLVEVVGEVAVTGSLGQARRVLTVQGMVVLALAVVLTVTALVAAWTIFA